MGNLSPPPLPLRRQNQRFPLPMAAAMLCLALALPCGRAGASAAPIDPCYSPLELAALFSSSKSRPSTKQALEDTEKKIENRKKKIRRKRRGRVKDARNQLRDSLNAGATGLFKDTQKASQDYSSHTCKFQGSDTEIPCCGTGDYACTDSTTDVANALKDYLESGERSCDRTAPKKIPIQPNNATFNLYRFLFLHEAHATTTITTLSRENYDRICRPWEESGEFFEDGDIDEGAFCEKYAQGKVDECEDALDDLKKAFRKIRVWEEEIDSLKDVYEELEERQEDIEDGFADEEGGGSPLCLECLQEIRDLNKPSGGEISSNVLTMGLGTALSIFGLKEARRSQRHANEALAMQGFPAENNFGHTLSGLSLGIPFVQQGLHGLTRPRHGCAQSYSPYGHHGAAGSMMHQQMQAYGMQRMQFQAMLGANNPMAAMFNPMAQMQANPYSFNPAMSFQMNANPMAAMFNPMAQMQFGANMNPMAAMFNPMAQMQFGANMNPMASMFNPMAQFQFNAGGNSFMPYNNMMQMPGMNQAFSTYRSQMAMQQMQMRMKMQQAMMAQQMSAQQEWMRRQETIGALTQELHRIQSQIQMVASGGSISSAFGSQAALSASVTTAGSHSSSGGPQHNPAAGAGSGGGGEELPVIHGGR